MSRCDCHIVGDLRDNGTWESWIEHCPLHASAAILRESLVEIIEWYRHGISGVTRFPIIKVADALASSGMDEDELRAIVGDEVVRAITAKEA